MERHLSEAAVMLAMAQWMFSRGTKTVKIHPDGMHAKHFDIRGWLETEAFERVGPLGPMREAGYYVKQGQSLSIEFKPGQGDVVGDVRGRRIVVEAKGGCINTRHPGQLSKLRRHIYEAVGMLLDRHEEVDRRIAAVPRHGETEKISRRMARRCHDAGIEIALVSDDGGVELCEAKSSD